MPVAVSEPVPVPISMGVGYFQLPTSTDSQQLTGQTPSIPQILPMHYKIDPHMETAKQSIFILEIYLIKIVATF